MGTQYIYGNPTFTYYVVKLLTAQRNSKRKEYTRKDKKTSNNKYSINVVLRSRCDLFNIPIGTEREGTRYLIDYDDNEKTANSCHR
jgi:hypothetical protein